MLSAKEGIKRSILLLTCKYYVNASFSKSHYTSLYTGREREKKKQSLE
jgi:hypothetical protein